MIVSRQDELTEVSELYCRVCDRLLAVAPASLDVVTFFYALVEGVWHRFYLDAGLLFWDEGQAPEEEEDLYEGDTYVDLSTRLNVVGKAIEEIRMANGRPLLSKTAFLLIPKMKLFCMVPTRPLIYPGVA